MAQLFSARANTAARLVLIAIPGAPALLICTLLIVARSDYVLGENRIPLQPVPFSHRHHVAEEGIDCRYCHAAVETSESAGMPATAVCMTCHSQLYDDSDMLAPVRNSYLSGDRLSWTRVNELPDYVYFAHAVHVNNGVACVACHGEMGEMRLTRQEAPLTMGWCLECHRDPGPNLSPPGAIYRPFDASHETSEEEAHALLIEYGIDPDDLTDCSVCHR